MFVRLNIEAQWRAGIGRIMPASRHHSTKASLWRLADTNMSVPNQGIVVGGRPVVRGLFLGGRRPLDGSFMHQHRAVASWIIHIFTGLTGVVAGVGSDGRLKVGVRCETVRCHREDVAG